MKVVLVSTSGKRGGAAIACGRLMKALQKSGADVKWVIGDQSVSGPEVISVNSSRRSCWLGKFRFLWERFVIWCYNFFCRQNLFRISIANTGKDISRLPEIAEADIVHLHWINLGFLSLKDLAKLIDSGKKIVWTTHDMWSFTGVCHYAGECRKYQVECECCPMLYRKNKRDLSYRIWKRKNKIFAGSGIMWVGCSEWIANKARKAALLKGMEIVSIPNPIDIKLFCRKDQSVLREKWNLPQAKKLLLFGADRIDDERKGFAYLVEALELLLARYPGVFEEMELMVFGRLKEDIEKNVPFKLRNVGYISETESMIEIYNCADLFLIPSLEDNLPNTIMESMACGTPVVGFNTGGIPEMIDHKANGYVAERGDSEDLMKGIYWSLFETDLQKLSEEAVAKVGRCYREEKIAGQYLECYDRLLKIRV